MCKLIGNAELISSSITPLLAVLAGILKVYENYTRLLIGPNSLPVPPWGSIYLDREH
ncbi:molecular chaperone TorD family protein [Bacillus spizizenii]|uniref:molecular chaperone TorD family protein n=1 Tax=Bacillus spizizenii TaxID=96241 RepID=UPI0012AEB768